MAFFIKYSASYYDFSAKKLEMAGVEPASKMAPARISTCLGLYLFRQMQWKKPKPKSIKLAYFKDEQLLRLKLGANHLKSLRCICKIDPIALQIQTIEWLYLTFLGCFSFANGDESICSICNVFSVYFFVSLIREHYSPTCNPTNTKYILSNSNTSPNYQCSSI